MGNLTVSWAIVDRMGVRVTHQGQLIQFVSKTPGDSIMGQTIAIYGVILDYSTGLFFSVPYQDLRYVEE